LTLKNGVDYSVFFQFFTPKEEEMTTRVSGYTDKAIYGNDTRMNICELDDNTDLDHEFVQVLKNQARSVACLILKSNLIKDPLTKTYSFTQEAQSITLAKYVKKVHGHNLTDEDKYRDENVAGYGTAFVAGEREAWTAAHCICHHNSDTLDETRWKNTYLVFNFFKKGKIFDKKDIYKIKGVKAHKFTRVYQSNKLVKCSDWLQLELDRKVEGIAVLKIDFSAVALNEEVYLLGHPMGMPLKVGLSASVKNTDHKDFFESDLPAFKGNSGSPVFSKTTKLVVGMLFSGNEDYERVPNYNGTGQNRYTAHRVTQEEIRAKGYEKCHRTHKIGDEYAIAADGRKKRRKLSNMSSENHKIKTDGIFLSPNFKFQSRESELLWRVQQRTRRFFVLCCGGYDPNETIFEEIRKIRADKSNFIESCYILQWQREGGHDKEIRDLAKIAKNASAYDASFEMAQRLHDVEQRYARRYSPEKIFDLLQYGNLKKCPLSDEFMERVLKRMHKEKQNYFRDKNPAERLHIVEKAVIKEQIKALRGDSSYSMYSQDQIEKIVHRQFEKQQFLTLEVACEELGFEAPPVSQTQST
jgi:V8-like Glu-specific endopeptidase